METPLKSMLYKVVPFFFAAFLTTAPQLSAGFDCVKCKKEGKTVEADPRTFFDSDGPKIWTADPAVIERLAEDEEDKGDDGRGITVEEWSVWHALCTDCLNEVLKNKDLSKGGCPLHWSDKFDGQCPLRFSRVFFLDLLKDYSVGDLKIMFLKQEQLLNGLSDESVEILVVDDVNFKLAPDGVAALCKRFPGAKIVLNGRVVFEIQGPKKAIATWLGANRQYGKRKGGPECAPVEDPESSKDNSSENSDEGGRPGKRRCAASLGYDGSSEGSESDGATSDGRPGDVVEVP